MTLNYEYLDFDSQDHDEYYDWITEYDGENVPDEIEALLEMEADFRQGR